MEREQIFIDPFKGPSSLLFIKAFTLWSIYPEIIFLTSFATLLVMLDHHVPGLSLKLPPTILTVLGTVIGFVLSYRTSSAYERYTEGRKQWSSITHVSRHMSCIIWMYCPHVIRLPTESRPATREEQLTGIIEKKSFLNLIEGFAVSLKHYLRGEHGIYYEDLYHLACFLPRYSFPAGHPGERADLQEKPDVQSGEKVEPGSAPTCGPASPPTCRSSKATTQVPSQQTSIQINPEPAGCQSAGDSRMPSPFPPAQDLMPHYNPPQHKFFNHLPCGILKSMWKGTRNAAGLRKKKASYSRRIHDDNIPLEMICCMFGYISTLKQRQVLDVPTANTLIASISALSDSLATLERILTTPIPFGYIVHLRLIIWGYLIFLPFQLLSTFGYVTIPAVSLISIAFLGFLEIGEEIENPFGYDSNDLDMDHFCQNIIARELMEISGLAPPDPQNFMFSSFNIPLFRQKDYRSAAELIQTCASSGDIQRVLHSKQSIIHSPPRSRR